MCQYSNLRVSSFSRMQSELMGKKVFQLCFSALLFAAAAFAPCFLLLAPCSSAQAQQPKIPRIGFLMATSSGATAARLEAFRQGLRELGYVEGKNVVIEWRSSDGNSERGRALAAELVRLKPDIIVTA